MTILACGSSNTTEEAEDQNGSGGGANGGGANRGGGGSGANRGGNGGTGQGGFLFDSGSNDGPSIDPDAFWANDPPPQACLDSGLRPVVPGGTPDCPDDKNRQGCPCFEVGKKAPCWPGYRKNRNRGICHDGTTTCILRGENQGNWGPCEGYQLPTGTTGKEACGCFSAGTWHLVNLMPCFFRRGSNDYFAGVSTIWNASTKVGDCPATLAKPSGDWTDNDLTVDCAGHFKLCYALKAGDFKNPQPTDCTMVQVCTEGDYPEPNKTKSFPPLPSWIAAEKTPEGTCAAQFASSGGYGEMTVVGETVECDEINDGHNGPKVFNRISYCRLACSEPNPPADCAGCQSGGSGQF